MTKRGGRWDGALLFVASAAVALFWLLVCGGVLVALSWPLESCTEYWESDDWICRDR